MYIVQVATNSLYVHCLWISFVLFMRFSFLFFHFFIFFFSMQVSERNSMERAHTFIRIFMSHRIQWGGKNWMDFVLCSCEFGVGVIVAVVVDVVDVFLQHDKMWLIHTRTQKHIHKNAFTTISQIEKKFSFHCIFHLHL